MKTQPDVRFTGLLIASIAAVLAATHTVGTASGRGTIDEPPVQKAADKGPAMPKMSTLLKLAEPWPSAEELRRHKDEADARPLFASGDPIEFTLAANFKALNDDRNSSSTQRHEGELRIAREDGRTDTIPVALRARGHLRRMARTCEFVPIRVEFPKSGLEGTIFEHQHSLKLVVQCARGDEYAQFLVREYLAYRIFNMLTPQSVRARLAKITYLDSSSQKKTGIRYGMFLEDDSDVARRMEGRAIELPRAKFADIHPDTLLTMMVFEYMIGNTDFSLYALHNIIFVQTQDRMLYTVPYDFDISGLVHPPYAAPARGLPIRTVDERLYRGPCRAVEQVEPIVSNFQAKRDAIFALLESIPELDKQSRQDVKTFLNGFYSSIKTPGDVKRRFSDQCSKAPTM